MSITLKSSKPRMFTTVLEVVLFSSIIHTEDLNFDINDNTEFSAGKAISNLEIENYIIRADSIINAFLKNIYSAPSGLRIDSWVTPPRYAYANSVDKNKLLAVKINNTEAYTSYYTVEFTSTTEFKVTSSLEGAQGTGDTSSDFTTDNGVITIGTNSWDSNIDVASGDKFYFSVIDCYELIFTISNMLSASMILSEKYSEQIPNANDYAEELWRKAENLLSRLADPEDTLALTETSTQEGETTSIDYRISLTGVDVSSYLTENKLDP